jgi:hypothetical protein
MDPKEKTMAREPKYGATFNGWERLLASLEANKETFPQLDAYRAQLAAMLNEAREASAEQTAMAAGKQQATQRIQTLLVDGRKLATVLRTVVRQHFGNRSEKLAEFDLQPLRTRTRTVIAGAGTGAGTKP